ncbi:CU044_2847 family protein [Nocardia sp. R7R-8]|uniref:CU044_2847 family protein n=1 Tax=Nocardia sp. R7R-8 TaxID=3459304 RepID=UPI00403DD2CC
MLVETVQLPGSQQTSAVDRATERVGDAFDSARDVIVAAASATLDAIEEMGRRSIRPDQVEVEFGVSITAKADIVIAGASANAALKVRLVYKNTTN